MDEAISDILDALRGREALDAAQLDRIVRKHSRRARDGRRLFARSASFLITYMNAKLQARLGSAGTSTRSCMRA